MTTLFEKIWHDSSRDTVLYKSAARGVMALADFRPVTHGTTVVASRTPAPKMLDLSPAERLQVRLVADTIQRVMSYVYPIDLVAHHEEGYQVPHAHVVLVPSYARGDSDKLHHPEQRMQPDAEYFSQVAGELTITDQMVEAEAAGELQRLLDHYLPLML